VIAAREVIPVLFTVNFQVLLRFLSTKVG